ncbi:MAG: trans-aconitate 2-methyltransferase [Xanthobacteraceae bacterium]
MEDWSARQYLKFEDERTRPPRDLLAQVPLARPRRVVDLGCGPGNSTALLVERYPQAQVVGLDSSPDMLRKARERLPHLQFVEADICSWLPQAETDLLFSNAVMQWLPDHAAVLRRLIEALAPGGVLAVQMPDNTREPALVFQGEIGRSGPWRDYPDIKAAARDHLPALEAYYDLLQPVCSRLDIWHTVYNHVMASPQAIVEWFKGSSLQPFLSPLDASARQEFLVAYAAKIAGAYKPRVDGKVLLRFPRLFIVAVR